VSNNDGRLASLDIMDNGKGIPVDTAGQIFEPFFTTETTGTGLGLYLARELCELNKCHLGYIPAEIGGSCFRIHFAPSQAKADRPVADTPTRSLSLTT
jgi:two-component system sensor histidine kinase PilS (NtrC family)